MIMLMVIVNEYSPFECFWLGAETVVDTAGEGAMMDVVVAKSVGLVPSPVDVPE